MVTVKKHSSRQGWFSKATNAGVVLLGLSRVLEIVFMNIGTPREIPRQIIRGATFGFSEGSLNLEAGAAFYGAPAAAVTVGGIKSYLLRKYPVRR